MSAAVKPLLGNQMRTNSADKVDASGANGRMTPTSQYRKLDSINS